MSGWAHRKGNPWPDRIAMIVLLAIAAYVIYWIATGGLTELTGDDFNCYRGRRDGVYRSNC